MNIALAFLNDEETFEKENIFIIDNIEYEKKDNKKCCIKNIKPIHFSDYIPICGYTINCNEEDELEYNITYKCYYMVSSALKGNKLKEKFLNELISCSNDEIKRLNKELEKEQLRLNILNDTL